MSLAPQAKYPPARYNIYAAERKCGKPKRDLEVFLSGAEVKTFSPERTFATAMGALNELYNTESRLLAGRIGVV